jgi:hypothetical protein
MVTTVHRYWRALLPKIVVYHSRWYYTNLMVLACIRLFRELQLHFLSLTLLLASAAVAGRQKRGQHEDVDAHGCHRYWCFVVFLIIIILCLR